MLMKTGEGKKASGPLYFARSPLKSSIEWHRAHSIHSSATSSSKHNELLIRVCFSTLSQWDSDLNSFKRGSRPSYGVLAYVCFLTQTSQMIWEKSHDFFTRICITFFSGKSRAIYNFFVRSCSMITFGCELYVLCVLYYFIHLLWKRSFQLKNAYKAKQF